MENGAQDLKKNLGMTWKDMPSKNRMNNRGTHTYVCKCTRVYINTYKFLSEASFPQLYSMWVTYYSAYEQNWPFGLTRLKKNLRN